MLQAYRSVLGFCRWHFTHWTSLAQCPGIENYCSWLVLPASVVPLHELRGTACFGPCRSSPSGLQNSLPESLIKTLFCYEAYEVWLWLTCPCLMCWCSVCHVYWWCFLSPSLYPPAFACLRWQAWHLERLFGLLVRGTAQQGLTGSHQWC